MPLNHKQILAFPKKAKPYKKPDGNGLFLQVNPSGSKLWRYRYTFNGKEKQFALGSFPLMSLQEARDRHYEVRKLVSTGVDPSAQRKEQKQFIRDNPSTTFKEFALEWHTRQKGQWRSRHSHNILARLQVDIFPQFGDIAIEKVAPSHVIEAIELICERGAYDMAKRTLQTLVRIFDYAIGKEKIQFNPADRRKSLIPKRKSKNFAAIHSDQLPELLEKLGSMFNCVWRVYEKEIAFLG